MANEQNLTSWLPGQSGNPAGKPKGTRHLSTHIRELMEDEDFEAWLRDPKEGFKQYVGTPVRAIIQVAINKAVQGDLRTAEWLAKHGYGTKVAIDHTIDYQEGTYDLELAREFAAWFSEKTKS